MYKYCLAVIFTALLASGCTWVKPTEAGARVVVAEPFNVRDCSRLSTITTSVKHAVGQTMRNQEKVALEVEALARNEAAIRGGDTIVPKDELHFGTRSFDVYRCATG